MKALQRRLVALAIAIPLLAAAPAREQSDLQAQLALLMGGDDSSTEKDKPGETRAVQTGWVLKELDAKGGKVCAITHRDGLNFMGYIGPTKTWKKGYFFVSGPKVPYSSNMVRRLRVSLATDGESDQTVVALNLAANKVTSVLLFELIDFPAALEVMEDSEIVAVIGRDDSHTSFGQALFSGGWTGGHAAREKLRSCIAAQG